MHRESKGPEDRKKKEYVLDLCKMPSAQALNMTLLEILATCTHGYDVCPRAAGMTEEEKCAAIHSIVIAASDAAISEASRLGLPAIFVLNGMAHVTAVMATGSFAPRRSWDELDSSPDHAVN